MKLNTLVLGIAFLLPTCACNSSKPIPQPPQGVQVEQVELASSPDSNTRFSAIIMPDSQVPLAFRVPGYVVSLMQVRGADGTLHEIGEGDRVPRGAVLASLRRSEYSDKVQQASSQMQAAGAAAQKAKLDFDRATRLYGSQSLTKPEYDAARAQYDATQAQMQGARAQRSEASIALRDTRLTAPLTGDVVKKIVERGSLVGPGTAAFVIANTDIVKVTVGVPDVIVRSLKVGTPVSISTEAVPNRTFNARVSRIAAAADPKTRNFDVEVAVPNRDHVLKAGMIASLELASSGAKDPVPVVPISAIVQSPSGAYGVFVIAKGNPDRAAFRAVDVGDVRGNEIEIHKGVVQGDTIITNGATSLKDGQAVEVLK